MRRLVGAIPSSGRAPGLLFKDVGYLRTASSSAGAPPYCQKAPSFAAEARFARASLAQHSLQEAEVRAALGSGAFAAQSTAAACYSVA